MLKHYADDKGSNGRRVEFLFSLDQCYPEAHCEECGACMHDVTGGDL